MNRLEETRLITIKIVSILFIVLFVYTATSKLLTIGRFKLQLEQFPIISSYADWIAWGIPMIEILIAGLFLFPKYMLQAFYASFSLMTIFTTYIILVLKFSDSIPCSCGGVISALGWKEHLVLNIAFIILSLLGIRLSSKRKKYLSLKKTT